jgi:GT2 family glycosyltransferase
MNVLIATHGRPDLLQRTLQSLADVRRPVMLQRIIVVENGSDAGARQVCAALAERLPLDYYNRRQPGKSRALQWAIDHIIHQGLIVFFDDDIRLSPGVLEAYAAATEVHGPRCFYGGPFGVDYEAPPPLWLHAYLPRSAIGWNPAQPNEEIKRLRFLGFNYAAFAEAICTVGGFNPDIGPGARRAGTEGNPTGQETEMQKRLLAAGYQPMWVPDAMVWHHVPADRCTPSWALHRVYRNRLSKVLLREHDLDPNAAAVCGLPRWMLHRYLRAWLAAKGSVLRPMAAQRRFEVRVREAELRGELAGIRARAKAVAKIAHDPPAPRPRTDVDAG